METRTFSLVGDRIFDNAVADFFYQLDQEKTHRFVSYSYSAIYSADDKSPMHCASFLIERIVESLNSPTDGLESATDKLQGFNIRKHR